MTCKDCLYHENCHSEIAYGMGSDDLTGEYFTDIETRCRSFKNKADVVEVKHGEWVKAAAYNDGIINTVKCSICETFQPIGEWDWQAYCANCGAKMDKKEGAEE